MFPHHRCYITAATEAGGPHSLLWSILGGCKDHLTLSITLAVRPWEHSYPLPSHLQNG